jgi:hypothetical protein
MMNAVSRVHAATSERSTTPRSSSTGSSTEGRVKVQIHGHRLDLVWPRLKLAVTSARITFWCLVCGTLAILAPYTIAAI